MKTITEHEKEYHKETPITWEDIGGLLVGLFIASIIGFLGWFFFGWLFGTPPTVSEPLDTNDVWTWTDSKYKVDIIHNGESVETISCPTPLQDAVH